jgi:hypothetical protein
MKKKPSNTKGQISAPIDERLQSSGIIRTLSAKIRDATRVEFDYFGELHRLAKVVAPQIGQIHRTFPEYTPHDWNLHVLRLFGLCDRLIGDAFYEGMYPAELFVVAAGLSEQIFRDVNSLRLNSRGMTVYRARSYKNSGRGMRQT